MRHQILFFVSLLSLNGLFGDTLHAHGGGFQPPPGVGTPQTYLGIGGGGASSAHGGGPPGPGLRPAAGPKPAPPEARPPRITSSRNKAQRAANRFDDWHWWWELNGGLFLSLKRKLLSERSASENGEEFVGAPIEDNRAITRAAIRKEIQPTLRAALKDPYFEARSGAVIALAKVSTDAQADLVPLLCERLADEQRTVREAACLALGILGSKAAVPILLEVAKNTPHGKRLVGRGGADVLNRTRAFACVALGLIGKRTPYTEDEGTIQELVQMIGGRPGADPDLQIGPALALGLIESELAVPAMLEVLENPRAPEHVRAHVAVALGKIGAHSAMRLLLAGMADRSSHVKRSCAIALGLLATAEDREVVRSLMGYGASDGDRAHRNFCLIALGQIGAPPGLALLRRNLRRGQVHDRTFSALGLGVHAFRAGGTEPAVAAEMLQLFDATKAISERGCYAIALGLMGHQDARESLRKVFESGGAQDLKGHVCTALGLLGDRESIPQVRELVAQLGDTDLRRRAAIALGLLRDPEAVEVLRQVIENSGRSKGVLGAATIGLGFVGGRTAVPILTDYLRRERGAPEAKDITRAFAAVALGFLGDKDEVPLLSNLQRDANYLAQTSALAELLSIR